MPYFLPAGPPCLHLSGRFSPGCGWLKTLKNWLRFADQANFAVASLRPSPKRAESGVGLRPSSPVSQNFRRTAQAMTVVRAEKRAEAAWPLWRDGGGHGPSGSWPPASYGAKTKIGGACHRGIADRLTPTRILPRVGAKRRRARDTGRDTPPAGRYAVPPLGLRPSVPE